MQAKALKNNSLVALQPLDKIPSPKKTIRILAALLLVIAILLCVICWAFLGLFALAICLVLLVVLVGISGYLGLSKRLLGRLGAIKLNEKIEPRVFGLLEQLSLTAGIAIPDVYIIKDDDCINILTVKMMHKKAAVIITTGILRSLERIELEAILASQVAFLRRKEEKIASLVTKIFPLLLLIDPFLMSFLFKVSGKNRAVLCDQTTVLLTRYPPGLYRVLAKVDLSSVAPKMLDKLSRQLTAPFWLIPLDDPRLKEGAKLGVLNTSDRMQMLTEM